MFYCFLLLMFFSFFSILPMEESNEVNSIVPHCQSSDVGKYIDLPCNGCSKLHRYLLVSESSLESESNKNVLTSVATGLQLLKNSNSTQASIENTTQQETKKKKRTTSQEEEIKQKPYKQRRQNPSDYRCQICSKKHIKAIILPENLEDHVNSHVSDFCDICKKSLDKDNIKSHRKEHFTEIKDNKSSIIQLYAFYQRKSKAHKVIDLAALKRQLAWDQYEKNKQEENRQSENTVSSNLLLLNEPQSLSVPLVPVSSNTISLDQEQHEQEQREQKEDEFLRLIYK